MDSNRIQPSWLQDWNAGINQVPPNTVHWVSASEAFQRPSGKMHKGLYTSQVRTQV